MRRTQTSQGHAREQSLAQRLRRTVQEQIHKRTETASSSPWKRLPLLCLLRPRARSRPTRAQSLSGACARPCVEATTHSHMDSSLHLFASPLLRLVLWAELPKPRALTEGMDLRRDFDALEA